ncbi:hypothetical protein [Corynebacterium aurimucosum]|uniref:hypothetical protein n=1 Tax=Corynebacterium aurimucosum TaxID=169292 RepID=UPI000C7FB4E9|nr:hypothetical protein [Corynebacterium aurimucosum]PMC68405.1 hypothetical protein CJ201_11190 [Corynebacterium aurimucosum]
MRVLKPTSLIVGLALAALTASPAHALTFDPEKVPPRTQMTVRYADGNSVSTGNGHESRAALSLAKLYLGMWVLKYGAPEDLTRFIGVISGDPVAAPITKGMATAAPAAADGYRQDFGTARIPGIIGTKFGWSDDRQVHASASFGPGYSVAANTYGSPADLTTDVLGAVEVSPQAPSLPTPLQDAHDRACAELKRAVPSSSQVC